MGGDGEKNGDVGWNRVGEGVGFNREQGTGNREQGSGIRDQGLGSGTWDHGLMVGNVEWRSRELLLIPGNGWRMGLGFVF